MVRKILLAGIMIVAVVIIVVGLQLMHQKEKNRNQARNDNQTLPARPTGVRITKYDKNNNLLLVITGAQATQAADKGPVDIDKPVVTIYNKNNNTVITADTGRVESRDQEKMTEGWLKGNVVANIADRAREDNTILRCDEMKVFFDKGQISIPGALTIQSKMLDLTGVGLTGDRSLGNARVDHDVQVTMKQAGAGTFAKFTGDAPAPAGGAAAPPPKPPQPIVITCDGAMVFDGDSSRATFEREVRAAQGEDRVRSDVMVVEFDKGSTADAEPAPATPAAGGAMNIRRVVMTSDKKDGVVIEGPTRQGWGDRFEYDGRDGLIVYAGAPCRTTQKTATQTFQLEGSEVRFGRRRLLSQAENLPAGMTETSQKVLIVGKPARVVSVPTQAGESSALTGDRILFDEDSKVAWIEGNAASHAVAMQGKNRVEGVEVLFSQKTDTRGEKIWAKGPGRLDIVARAKDATAPPAPPSVVDFGGEMNYVPDENKADFTGGVNLVDRGNKVVGKKLTIEFGEGKTPGTRDVRRMIAVGDVVVTGEKLNAAAETLIYGYPAPGSTLTTAELTAKPGEQCEVAMGQLVCRSEKIDMTEVPMGEGKTVMHAKGWGKGRVVFTPVPQPEGAKPDAAKPANTASPFQVDYTRYGTYDDGKLEAVFDGAVRVKRTDMDLSGSHIVMTFVKKPAAAGAQKTAASLDVSGIVATDDVTLVSGSAADPTIATGQSLSWQRLKGSAELRGGDELHPAHIVKDRTELTAPLMVGALKDNQIDAVVTSGRGHLVAYTNPLVKPSPAAVARSEDAVATDLDAAQHGTKPAPAPAGAPTRLDITWTGEGFYKTLETKDPATEPTTFFRVKQNVHAVDGETDVTSDTLVAYMGPPAKPAAAPAPAADGSATGLKLELRNIFAVGNARAKAYIADGGYYRFAKGNSLEWDRLQNRMVVKGDDKEDAVVWDNSNQWTGKELVVNRTAEGKMEAESSSGRKIIFYEEGTPKNPKDDAEDWKPIF